METIKGDFRILLSGTPIQNKISELWNLIAFINPIKYDYIKDKDEF